ncbi:MAG TPA: BrnA antitoxin family protein [Rhodothermales bacterium]|nr:BrnA antitoxin family protein [Rhodothermales bacterium]
MSSSKEKRRKTLVKMRDEDIDYSDIPELDDSFWETVDVVMPATPEKKQISIKIDREVLDYFRKDGPGYQTRMNAVLRSFVRAKREKRQGRL